MIILFIFATIFIVILGLTATITMLIDRTLTSENRVWFFCLSATFFLCAWLLWVGGTAYVQDQLDSGTIVRVGNE